MMKAVLDTCPPVRGRWRIVGLLGGGLLVSLRRRRWSSGSGRPENDSASDGQR